MEITVHVRRRVITYVSVGGGLLLGLALLWNSSWVGDTQQHSLMELGATLLALFVGIVALVRFYSKKSNTILFIGTAFLGTAFLDGYHTIVTSSFFDDYFPSVPSSLIPWSWLASRFFLSALLLMSWWAWRREEKTGEAGKISERTVYWIMGALTLASFLFFAFVPLPRAYYPELFFGRPEEFVPGVFFLIALVGYLRKGHWKTDVFEHWIVLSIIVGLIAEVGFMSFSYQLFDMMFDMAHLLKIVSYVLVLIGLLISMYHLFRQAEDSVEEIRAANEALHSENKAREQAEEKLRASEQQFQTILEAAPQIIWQAEADGAVSYINQAWEDIIGMPKEEARGSGWATVIHPDDAPGLLAKWERAYAHGESYSGECRFRSKDGSYRTFDFVGMPVRDTSGEVIRWVGIDTDITERKQAQEALRESEERFQDLYDNAPVAYLSVGRDGRIRRANEQTAQLLGYALDDVIGRPVFDLYADTPAGKEKARQVFQRFIAGEPTRDEELQMRRADGRLTWISLTVDPVRDADGEIIETRSIVIDITERKRAEEALRQYANELERSNEELESFSSSMEESEEALRKAHAALQETNEQLRITDKAKSEFLANMSHELRTPMNSIIGFTGRVIKKAGDLLPPRQLTNLHTVQRNANHLMQLINNLLDLSKIEAGKMVVYAETFKLTPLVEEVLALSQTLVKDKPVALVVELPDQELVMHSDRMKLKQILINLTSNAIKFTDEGRVVIAAKRVSSSRAGGDALFKPGMEYLALRISDTGMGISSDKLQLIFEAFQQVDASMTRSVGGTGLGLTITQQLVNLLRGNLEVESGEGEGTTFTVILPLNWSQAGAVPSKETTREWQEQVLVSDEPCVLCIDDDVEVIDLLTSYLVDEGYHVVGALSGMEGVRKAKILQPAAITLDIRMPDTDGWVVLNELKSDPETQNIPVIIVTFVEHQSLGYKLGAADYIQKPIVPEALIGSIRRLLSRWPEVVLIVDDDPDTRALIREILEDESTTVRVAENGLAALESLNEEIPNLILLDLMMPVMDGFEMLRQMRENERWASIPVIVLTAKTLTEVDRHFLDQSVAAVIEKNGMTNDTILTEITERIQQIKRVRNDDDPGH